MGHSRENKTLTPRITRQYYARFRSGGTFGNGFHRPHFLSMCLQLSGFPEAPWSGRRSHFRHQDLRFVDPPGGHQGIQSSYV